MLVAMIFYQLQRGRSERFRLRLAARRVRLFQILVEMNHQFGSVRGFHFPLAHHRGAATGGEKRPRNSHHAFTGSYPSPGGVAGREHDQIGAEIKSHYFPRLDQSVLFAIAPGLCKKEVRVEWMTIVEHAVGGEMNRVESRRQALECFLVGGGACEDFAAILAEDLTQASDLRLRFRQRLE